jgi:hypothetical protein
MVVVAALLRATAQVRSVPFLSQVKALTAWRFEVTVWRNSQAGPTWPNLAQLWHSGSSPCHVHTSVGSDGAKMPWRPPCAPPAAMLRKVCLLEPAATVMRWHVSVCKQRWVKGLQGSSAYKHCWTLAQSCCTADAW